MQLLLDTKETTPPNHVSPSFQAHSSQSCREEWKQARAIYHFLEDTNQLRKLDAFEYCRKVAWFVRHDVTGLVRVASQQCHLRWCPLCAKTRTNFVSQQVQEWIETTKYSKFITLTIVSTDTPISDQINHLYDSFKRLRKKKAFKSKIKAGVWFFQITKNKTTGLWHPHLHIIGIGKFLSKRELSRTWLECTGDSKIVDIKAVKDKKQAAMYAARYAAKPADLALVDIPDAADLVMAMQGRRICGSWGKGCKISFRPCKPEDANQWTNIGDYTFVCYLQTIDGVADDILSCWKNQTPLSLGKSLFILERPPNDYDFQDPLELPSNVGLQTYMDFF